MRLSKGWGAADISWDPELACSRWLVGELLVSDLSHIGCTIKAVTQVTAIVGVQQENGQAVLDSKASQWATSTECSLSVDAHN